MHPSISERWLLVTSVVVFYAAVALDVLTVMHQPGQWSRGCVTVCLSTLKQMQHIIVMMNDALSVLTYKL